MTDLILALDVPAREEALAIAEACAPFVDRIKLGYPLILAAGLGIAGEIAELGCPLIADFKVADIPNTNRLIAEQAGHRRLAAAMCFVDPEEHGLERLASERRAAARRAATGA